MLLTEVYIVYDYAFVSGAVAFDLIGQLSEFSVRQDQFGNLYQQIFQ